MSLTTLPEEVLEHILLHVNVEDVLSVLCVVGEKGCEGFWRNICLQNGYNKVFGGDESWKDVFYRNISWLKGSYLKAEYNIRDWPESECDPHQQRNSISEGAFLSHTNDEHSQSFLDCLDFYPSNEHIIFLKGTQLLSQNGHKVSIRNVENPQKLVQELQGVYLHSCSYGSTKLLIKTQTSVVIYSREKELYKELSVFNSNGPFSLSSYVLTDEYFVILKTDKKNVLVVDLNLMEEFSLPLSPKKVMPFTASVSTNILNIVILDGNDYVLRRYHLQTKEWLEDYLLFSGAALIQLPKVKINSKVMVSWSSLLEGRGVTRLKIWTSRDDSASNFTLEQPDSVIEPEDILWLILEEQYLIFSMSKKSFSIFNVNEPGKLETMVMSENSYCGQNVVSGILVLSYTHCFKLIDYKNATYLREVVFDNGITQLQFCTNEYFYIVFNTFCSDETKKKLCIYDFRGKTVT